MTTTPPAAKVADAIPTWQERTAATIGNHGSVIRELSERAYMIEEIAALRAALASRSLVAMGEPVAYWHQNPQKTRHHISISKTLPVTENPEYADWSTVPLYAAQPPQASGAPGDTHEVHMLKLELTHLRNALHAKETFGQDGLPDLPNCAMQYGSLFNGAPAEFFTGRQMRMYGAACVKAASGAPELQGQTR